MPVSKDFLPLIGSSGNQGSTYEIDQSIRFNDDDSPILKKTYSSAGTEETFTLSMWVKRGNIGAGLGAANLGLTLFSGGSSVSNYGEIVFRSSGYGVQDSLHFYNSASGSINFQLVTTQLFRDTSAWYHIVCVMDTTNNVSSERMRIYVNGLRVTDFSTETYPSQNAVPSFNTATEHGIGGFAVSTDIRFFDGYLAEIHFLDGYAYGPENFGEFESNGIWIPKEYTGSYGTNGFFIDGRDSSDLGDDESGQGNDFTASGLAAHDQMIDTPTNNFCVMNYNNKHSNVTLSDGSLHALGSGTSIAYPSGGTHLIPSSGKWYAEIRIINRIQPHEYPTTGVYNNSVRRLITNSNSPGSSDVSGAKDIGFGADERRLENGTNTDPWGTGMDDGNIAAIAIDMDNKKIWWGHNQTGSFVWQVSGNPNTGANPANTIDFNTTELIFGNSHYSNSEVHWNFGQDGTFGGAVTAQGNADTNGIGNFYYPVPTGYMALCSKNMGS